MHLKFKVFSLFCFLFLVFAIPRVAPDLKLALIFLIFGTIIYNGSVVLPDKFISYLSFLILAPSIVLAFVLNNELQLVLSSLKLNFLFPFILYILFLNYKKELFSEILVKAALWAMIFSFLVNLSTLIHFLNLFPVNLNSFFYPEENRIGFNEGFVHMVNSSFSYWLYLLPLIYCNTIAKKPKWFFFLLLTFILAILSGRRILLIPYFIVFIYYIKNLKVIITILIALFICYMLFSDIFNLDFNIISQRFFDAANGAGDSDARSEQHDYFWKYIAERPLLGYGMGSYMPNYLRSDLFKTAYENTFDYIVFERGVFGFFMLIFFLFILVFKIFRSNILVAIKQPLVVATITLLFASYTNPYWLSSFDYTIPFAILMRFADNKL
jgi:hypothetical protein